MEQLPSKHAYLNAALGIALPIVAAFLYWRRFSASELTTTRLVWTFVWTYPLMVLGTLSGEVLVRNLDSDFYARLGDHPGQMANLFSGWFLAHGYLVLAAVLFVVMKKL